MVWARRHRVNGTASKVEVNLRAIPLLVPCGWRVYPTEDWPLIGAAPKGYLAYGDPEQPDCLAYIAKKGRLAVGAYRECVTEEIISKIGAMLPIRMAKSRLVRLPTEVGAPPDVRFLSQNFVRRGEEELVHGVEIMGEYFNAKPEEIADAFNLRDKRAEQSFYTIPNMVEVLKFFCREERVEGELAGILDGFARMLAFDALIGAPDRHALNWGVLQSRIDLGRARRFAPLFDTARGLFREHTDEKLGEIARDGRRMTVVREYAEKSRPVFGVAAAEPRDRRCNHFELIDYAMKTFPDELGRTICRFVNAVHLAAVETMIRRKFRRIITPLRASFIVNLLRHRHERLKMLMSTR
jgi:hypothetical protein